ncbi:MAG: hypothetical protein ABIP74_02725 [Candidatus Saccharimonas sp.]
MNNIHMLIKELNDTIARESTTSVGILCNYITGELLGDYDGTYTELRERDATVNRIAELSASIETADGGADELRARWEELKSLVKVLEQEDR